MTRRDMLTILLTMAVVLVGGPLALGAPSPPTGEVVIAFPVTIAPAWFDPAETPAQITPFALLYALHDGLVRVAPILTGGSGTSIVTGAVSCVSGDWTAGTINGTPTLHPLSANGATCASTPCTLVNTLATVDGVARAAWFKFGGHLQR
jgi:hypothetical protein